MERSFKMKKWTYLLLIPVLFLTACNGGKESGGGQMDYDETKKMVVDILKTDEGKKAIQQVISDEKMKEELVMDQQVVSDSIQKTLTSEKGVEFWKKSFEDPKFAETVAKNMKKENEKLLKELMKDPEYQGMMMDILKDPEMQKEYNEVLKSKEYREHLQTVIIETFESPLFKSKLQDVLKQAGQEGGEKKEEGKEGGGQEGGGEGEDKGQGQGGGASA
jgi:spore germination protein D